MDGFGQQVYRIYNRIWFAIHIESDLKLGYLMTRLHSTKTHSYYGDPNVTPLLFIVESKGLRNGTG